MINLVLALLAVLIVIVIFRVMPRKAWKWIGGVTLVSVLALTAFTYINNHRNHEQYLASQNKKTEDLKNWLTNIDFWAFANSKKRDDGMYYIKTHDLKKYAADLYQARDYDFWFINTLDSTPPQDVATTLDTPLMGVKEVKIKCDASLSQTDCVNVVKRGYQGGFLIQIFTLDEKQYFAIEKHVWMANK